MNTIELRWSRRDNPEDDQADCICIVPIDDEMRVRVRNTYICYGGYVTDWVITVEPYGIVLF
jgi:hypothetical protein